MGEPLYLWDVFICHASEDKDDFARPLADQLRKEGVSVWFDEFEVRLGDSIAGKIEKGLANSKAGVVVISRRSLEKGWATYETNAIKQLHIASRSRLIPIYKDISPEELRAVAPGISDIRGLDARNHSVSECAYEIVEAVRPDILSQIHLNYAYRKLQRHGSGVLLDPAKVRSGPKRREKLPERDILRIAVLHGTFLDIFHDTLEDWIESFCHDLNYEREIRVWERMASCYLRCVSGHHFKHNVNQRILGVLLSMFSGATGEELQKAFSGLPRVVAKRLYTVVDDWLHEWQNTLELVLDREFSDDEEVGKLIERHQNLSAALLSATVVED